MMSHLTRAAFVVGTIFLIDDDRILNVVHGTMLEKNVPGKSSTSPPPGLDPHTVLCISECHCFHRYILHTSFL